MVTNRLALLGYDACGVDSSESGISEARRAFPAIPFHVASVYDDLPQTLGTFDVVVSLEVIEHLYAPRRFIGSFHGLLRGGGTGILSTPYHGYWKNLAIAVTGRSEAHFSPLWDGGHIKFWSISSLRSLLLEQGFESLAFSRVGRLPVIAMSMVAAFAKPSA